MEEPQLTPDQLKLLTLQFIGQNIGELKQLDSNLIAKTNTLRGNELNPEGILASIAPPTPVQPLPPQPQLTQTIVAQPQLVTQPIITPAAISTDQSQLSDESQLEFNFNTSPYTVEVFNRLQALEKKIDKIIDILSDEIYKKTETSVEKKN